MQYKHYLIIVYNAFANAILWKPIVFGSMCCQLFLDGPWLCGGLGLSMPQVLRGPRGSCVLSTWFFN